MSQSAPAPSSKASVLNNKWYNVLKHVAWLGLPALAALYGLLAKDWGWPHTSQVLEAFVTVNTALGGLLGYSTATYNASETKYTGWLTVAEDEAKKVFSLVTNGDPNDVSNLSEATFKVVQTKPISSPGSSSDSNTTTTAHGASVPAEVPTS